MSLEFQDSHDPPRMWRIKITVGVCERFLETGQADLYSLLDDKMKLLKAIVGDPRQLLGVVWGIVLTQAEGMQLPVSIGDFRESIDGDALERMGQAFLEAVADFSPASMRANILASISKGKEIQQAENRRREKILAKMDPETFADRMEVKANANLEKWMDELRDSSPSGGAASSASLPIPSP
jgi:hypothetical protein